MTHGVSQIPDVPGVAVDTGWHFGVPVQAAWGDIDKLGHVTNASYWRWCDDARVQYIMHVGFGEPAPETPSFVVVSAEGEFLSSMRYRQRGIMTCRTTRIGRSSTDTEHALWLADGCAFRARFKLVLVDNTAGGAVPIEERQRTSIRTLEQALPEELEL